MLKSYHTTTTTTLYIHYKRKKNRMSTYIFMGSEGLRMETDCWSSSTMAKFKQISIILPIETYNLVKSKGLPHLFIYMEGITALTTDSRKNKQELEQKLNNMSKFLQEANRRIWILEEEKKEKGVKNVV